MICYVYQLKQNQAQEVWMNNNVVDSIIATLIVGLLSTAIGFVLPVFGFSTQQSVTVALFALAILLLAARRFYPDCKRALTRRLLEDALRPRTNTIDTIVFKNRLVDLVQQENPQNNLRQSVSFKEYQNQKACESAMCEAFQSARRVKILTIRGEKYFLGSRSIFHDLYSEKQGKDFKIEMLILSPESGHITEELARKLKHHSAEGIKRKMRIALDNLKHIAEQDEEHFEVRCYTETPKFKVLVFDDSMFVTAFARAKNDENTAMYQIVRDGNPLFTGFEKYFDDLWATAVSPQ